MVWRVVIMLKTPPTVDPPTNADPQPRCFPHPTAAYSLPISPPCTLPPVATFEQPIVKYTPTVDPPLLPPSPHCAVALHPTIAPPPSLTRPQPPPPRIDPLPSVATFEQPTAKNKEFNNNFNNFFQALRIFVIFWVVSALDVKETPLVFSISLLHGF